VRRCDSTFENPSDRDQHVRSVHEKRRDHACPYCAATFGTMGDLTTHVRSVHEKRRDHACTTAPLRSGERPGGARARVVHRQGEVQ